MSAFSREIAGAVQAAPLREGNRAFQGDWRALYADWDLDVPGVQVNRFCASGLEAVNTGAMKIRSGASPRWVQNTCSRSSLINRALWRMGALNNRGPSSKLFSPLRER